MRWFRRGFWMMAWGVWAYLGVGLYRELPRDLGPAVCELELDEYEEVFGFLAGKNTIVTQCFDGGRLVFRIRDARSGHILQQWLAPSDSVDPIAYGLSRLHHFWVGANHLDPDGDPERVEQLILDLESGRRLDVKEKIAGFASPRFHPRRRWALFCGRLPGRSVREVNVVDLETGASLFHWRGRETEHGRQMINGDAFFVGNDIAIPVRPTSDPTEEAFNRTDLEIWRIGEQAPDRVFRDLGQVEEPSALGDRVVWQDCRTTPSVVKVLDLRTGTVVFRHDPSDWNRPPSLGDNNLRPTPEIAADGETVFIDGGELWRIDTATALWQDRQGEYVLGLAGETFDLIEDWTVLLPFTIPFRGERPWETIAVRDARTGKLRYRYWKPPQTHGTNTGWHGDHLFMDDGNRVYAMPPRVNWLLLFLCQIALALPLFTAWITLRWRRRRAARRFAKAAA